MAETAVETGKRGRKAAIKAAKEAEELDKPKSKGRKAQTESGPTFWQKVAQVAKADWGPRANIYLYRVEPVIDRRRSGTQTYITKYAEPISEDRILADHGSGRYKAMLNFRKPGAEQGDEVDSLYIDLLNLNFPPKIPPGDWVDDPNNKKWAWAKQSFVKEEQQGQTAADTVLDAIEIVDKLKGPHQDPVKTTLDTIKAVRELNPPAANPTSDLANLIAVAEKLRPAETVPQFVQLQFQALQAEISAARKRSDDLMDKLIANNAKPDEKATGISLVKEVVSGLKELMPEVKDIFPLGENGARQRPWWQECALLIAPYAGQFISPLGQVLAAGLANKMMAPQPGMNGIQPNPAQPSQQLPAGSPATMMPFLQMIAFPLVTHCRYMGPPDQEDPTEVGKDFALWVFNGYGSDSRYGQAILAAKAMGPTGIIAAFRNTPLWTDKGPQQNLVSLAELEPKLQAFFGAFLAFDPNERESDDEPEETDPGRPVIIETFSEQGV